MSKIITAAGTEQEVDVFEVRAEEEGVRVILTKRGATGVSPVALSVIIDWKDIESVRALTRPEVKEGN